MLVAWDQAHSCNTKDSADGGRKISSKHSLLNNEIEASLGYLIPPHKIYTGAQKSLKSTSGSYRMVSWIDRGTIGELTDVGNWESGRQN